MSEITDLTQRAEDERSGGATLSPVKRALQEIRELRTRLAAAERAAADALSGPVAIVGAGMRFPGGVRDAASFWELMASGGDAITEIPRDRWDWRQYFDRNPETRGAMYSVRGGFLEDIGGFDADFFGIAPREAAMLDPQQRLLHEVAWHALEDAAIAPDSLPESSVGSKTGIFLGLSNVDYYRAAFEDDLRIDAYVGSGNSPSMAAGRLAYTLGVHGPAMTVDTSCSSSLVAVHLAVESLRRGESDLALAGGVNVILAPQMHIAFSRARMLAPDGRCKTFDAAADGYVRSEGCGVVVLKRLADAMRDKDRVLAVIRGSAMNHDGRSGGLTAPSGRAQAALLREAYARAGVALDQVGMIEAHGTGTSLGDPIEMEALGEVFQGRKSGLAPIWVGSVKTNLGHTEAASGMAGLFKVMLSLQARIIPKHLHFRDPSPLIPWGELPFRVPTERADWALGEGQGLQARRVGGVSSFGFSGSNAHLVLEEFVAESGDKRLDEGPQIAVISGRSAAALAAGKNELRPWVEAHADVSLGDVCGTLAQGRSHFGHRAGWVVRSREELLERLGSETASRPGGGASDSPSLCFLFTGQGSEHAGMGLELLERSRVFGAAVQRLERALDGGLGTTIASIWANQSGELERASLVQPALYAYGWALSELWRGWGVSPQVVLGHSLGEYVAATVAGVTTPEEGIRLVVARGRLTEALGDPGGMVAVGLDREALGSLLGDFGELSLAAANSPSGHVVSGRLEAIERFEGKLREGAMRWKRLRTTHGFHSAALDGVLDAFEAEAAKVNFKVPEVRWISNLTGRAVERDRPVDAKYWRRHLRETVQFSAGLAAAEAGGAEIFLELGPEPQLLALADGNGIGGERSVASIRRGGSEGEWRKLMDAAVRLYTSGVDLYWKGIAEGRRFRKVGLPGYPFERLGGRRYWLENAGPDPERVWEAMAAAAADQAAMAPMGLDVARIAERQSALNGWALALMFSTLRELGCFSADIEAISVESLAGRFGVSPTQRRLVEWWLGWLADEGILSASDVDGQRVYTLAPGISANEAEFDSKLDLKALWLVLEPLLASDQALHNYLVNCSAGLLRVVRGEMNPLETLFPGGDGALATALYERSPAAVYLNGIVAAAIAARARLGARTAMGFSRRLRVLEIGAGTGATTAAVLKLLAPEQVLYTFSDVSEVFLGRARQRFRSQALEFAFFDMDRDEDAVAAAGRYDVVLLANALHVATDLHAALQRVRQVLQPGGMLVLLETTVKLAWSDVSIGMLEGWQHVKDETRKRSPLISVERWSEELEREGFVHFCVAPGLDQPTAALGLHVLLAQLPAEEAGVQGQDAASSSALPGIRFGADGMLAGGEKNRLDAGGQERVAVTGGAAKLRAEVSAAPAKERVALVVEVTTRMVAQVLGGTSLPAKDARLMDLGLDSLMAIELRNRLQSTFGIEELSSTLMFDHPTSEAMGLVVLGHLGYRGDGQELELSLAEPLEADGAALNGRVKLHSDEELDAMSDDEIAKLLRGKLGQ